MKRWYTKLLTTTLFILSMAATVSAGSWATVKIEEMPAQIEAGQTAQITFTVWQHDQRLVHELNSGANGTISVDPIAYFENATTGETVQFAAQKSKQVGYYTVAIQLPSQGEWSWYIEPAPLNPSNPLPNLTVVPAKTIKLAGGGETAVVNALTTPFIRIIASVSLLLLIGGFLFLIKKQSSTPISHPK